MTTTSTPRFKKHKSWMGKDLTLHIGGGDRRISDTVVLEGPQFARFVGMGFLTQIKDGAEPATQAGGGKVAPTEAMTKSGISKMPSQSLKLSTRVGGEPTPSEPAGRIEAIEQSAEDIAQAAAEAEAAAKLKADEAEAEKARVAAEKKAAKEAEKTAAAAKKEAEKKAKEEKKAAEAAAKAKTEEAAPSAAPAVEVEVLVDAPVETNQVLPTVSTEEVPSSSETKPTE